MHNENINMKKRGVTLAELSIVLALVAIMSTMIVSFSVMVRAYADRVAGYRTLQESQTSFEDVFDFFVSAADTKNFFLTSSSDVKVRAAETDEKTDFVPVFPGDPDYENVADCTRGDVLCALNAEGDTVGWMFVYEGVLYAQFASQTATDLPCKGFSDIRYLFVEQSGKEDQSHPLVRAVLSYEVPSVAEEKEIATVNIVRATRAMTIYREGGGGQ